MTPIITAKMSSSICTLFYSAIKWFMNRQCGCCWATWHLVRKHIFSTMIWAFTGEKWWFMFIEAYCRTLAINPNLAFWKVSLCWRIQTLCQAFLQEAVELTQLWFKLYFLLRKIAWSNLNGVKKKKKDLKSLLYSGHIIEYR